MKTRRFIAVFAALTMAAAIGSTSVFAAEPTTVVPGTDGNPTPESAGFEVKYDVDPSYTVTIPAGVDITTEDKTDSITLNEGALLEEGSKIKVVLEKGANTTSGNSFTAKTASGNSSASYQITQGENTVSVGDTVASLDKDTLSASLTFSKTETVKPTYAGTHAEVLTFTVSVESAVNVTSVKIMSGDRVVNDNSGALAFVGSNIQLKAETEPDGVAVTWESLNPDIATVDQDGVVTGVAEGVTTIKVTAGDKTATCSVAVVPEF